MHGYKDNITMVSSYWAPIQYYMLTLTSKKLNHALIYETYKRYIGVEWENHMY